MARQRHRGHGEGSIHQAEDGRWRGWYTDGDGRRHSRRFSSRRECAAWVNDHCNAVAQGADVAPTRKTLIALIDQRFAEVVEHAGKERTRESYESLTRCHIRPHPIARTCVVQLRASHLRTYYDELRRQGLSASTVLRIHAIIHAALAYGVAGGDLLRNVADAARPPAGEPHQPRTLSTEEARRLLATSRETGDRLYALWLLALVTGMRSGELLGLHWSEVDLDAGVVRITRTVQRLWRKGIVEGTPKSRTSRRVIAIPDAVADELHAHHVRQLQERLLSAGRWEERGLVFPSTIGRPMDQRRLLGLLHALCERAGLPRLKVHELRHTFGEHGADAGVNSRALQLIMGHQSITVTQRYLGRPQRAEAEATETIARELLDGTGEG